jgi:hypothetical protein
MERVILQFQTPQDLIGFRKQAGAVIIKSDVTNLILHCDCTKEVIAIAINEFGAVVKDI